MIINRPGAEFIYNGASYQIGDRIIGTPASEYEGLYGFIFEIRDGEDRETENDTPDLYCSFEKPVLPHRIARLEAVFSDLYGQPKRLEDITLDCVILAPEMVRVLLPDPKPLRQMVYSVQEEWADKGEGGSSVSYAYISWDSAAQFMQNRLREEREGGIIAGMRRETKFCEESCDDSYECYLDGDYCENHYRIFITAQPIVVSPEFVREMAEIHHTAMFTEDLSSALDEAEDITPQERARLMAEPGILERIQGSFEKYDLFWDCYWSVFRDVIDEKLKEYRSDAKEKY